MSIPSIFIGFNAFIHLEKHIVLKLGVLGFEPRPLMSPTQPSEYVSHIFCCFPNVK
jgi:hypothetical protein